ncbi:MAG: 1,4-dihydroxy-6-naphthoate synthase [Nitrospirae bacterium]|nr:1,4-dihydroxy-6-naphthoate synthase [Nitrospirota bacterium]
MKSFGFSPCPNDTIIFYALASKIVNKQGLDFEFKIDDVETLNTLAMKQAIDVSKVSCHAYCRLSNDYQFLKCGGAFGRGCGPLIVSKNTNTVINEKTIIAAPGKYTTAALLLLMYLESEHGIKTPKLLHMPFNEVMSSVAQNKTDMGLIIHEGRFTYNQYGLHMMADLGSWWEKETNLPIPLGGIVAKKNIGSGAISDIEELIQKSLRYGLNNRQEAMKFIKNHAQELKDSVIESHIKLYVNDYTLDMGDEGAAALHELDKRFRRIKEADQK